jgi:hypothetical protein
MESATYNAPTFITLSKTKTELQDSTPHGASVVPISKVRKTLMLVFLMTGNYLEHQEGVSPSGMLFIPSFTEIG